MSDYGNGRSEEWASGWNNGWSAGYNEAINDKKQCIEMLTDFSNTLRSKNIIYLKSITLLGYGFIFYLWTSAILRINSVLLIIFYFSIISSVLIFLFIVFYSIYVDIKLIKDFEKTNVSNLKDWVIKFKNLKSSRDKNFPYCLYVISLFLGAFSFVISVLNYLLK